jgi:hypothetical protein
MATKSEAGKKSPGKPAGYWVKNGTVSELVIVPPKGHYRINTVDATGNVQSGIEGNMPAAYRVIVGEVGNEQGHIMPCNATTDAGARRVLARELAAYNGDGWGRVEYSRHGDGWQELT